jgi:hypothetical protein
MEGREEEQEVFFEMAPKELLGNGAKGNENQP